MLPGFSNRDVTYVQEIEYEEFDLFVRCGCGHDHDGDRRLRTQVLREDSQQLLHPDRDLQHRLQSDCSLQYGLQHRLPGGRCSVPSGCALSDCQQLLPDSRSRLLQHRPGLCRDDLLCHNHWHDSGHCQALRRSQAAGSC